MIETLLGVQTLFRLPTDGVGDAAVLAGECDLPVFGESAQLHLVYFPLGSDEVHVIIDNNQ